MSAAAQLAVFSFGPGPWPVPRGHLCQGQSSRPGQHNPETPSPAGPEVCFHGDSDSHQSEGDTQDQAQGSKCLSKSLHTQVTLDSAQPTVQPYWAYMKLYPEL